MEFDYIVAGAGSAGCAVANLLSADSASSVLVIEAGPRDSHPLVRVPKGFALILGRNRFTWNYPASPACEGLRDEVWQRGKVLGGSSAINGMMYNRGNPADFEALAALGNDDWGWDNVLPVYKSMEDHALGATATRGVGGPLHVSPFPDPDRVGEAILAAGREIGLETVADCNESDAPRIGYSMCTLRNGRRVSSADAFIHPVARRPNLRVVTNSQVVRLLRQGTRITGVVSREGGLEIEYRARREVVLSMGALATPKLLQLSGIGPAEVLRRAGIDVIVDAPGVGANLREHRSPIFQFRLRRESGYNAILRSKTRQYLAGARWLIDGRGIIGQPAFDMTAFFKTRPELDRPDGQIMIAPFTRGPISEGFKIEREPGLQAMPIVLRPESTGRLEITAADPDADTHIVSNLLSTDYDRQVMAGAYRKIRELFSAAALEDWIGHETQPGSAIDGDDETLAHHALMAGHTNYHGVGTAAMGPHDADAIDQRLRVRGVEGLRVADSSIFPTMVSCGMNAPSMMAGWRAGQMIREDHS
jgi:choline dehydrogenase